jgi:hypothetical protein
MIYFTSLLFVSLMAAEPKKECVRWTWYGDVYNRTVICLQWRDKSNNEKDKNDRSNNSSSRNTNRSSTN